MPAIGALLLAAAGHAGSNAGDLVETPVGVRIHVEILPRSCADACTGGELPLTGGGGVGLLIWIAAGLLLVGAALLAVRAAGCRSAEVRSARPKRS